MIKKLNTTLEDDDSLLDGGGRVIRLGVKGHVECIARPVCSMRGVEEDLGGRAVGTDMDSLGRRERGK